jgi:hypothetical protein
MTSDEVTVSARELERLRRIETAARNLLEQTGGRRKATPTLRALAELRAALKEDPRDRVGDDG